MPVPCTVYNQAIKTFLIQNHFYSNAKKYKTKKPGQILLWRQIPEFKNIKLF